MKRGGEATEAKTRQQLAKEFVDTWTQPDKGKEDARVSIILCTFENPSLYEMLT